MIKKFFASALIATSLSSVQAQEPTKPETNKAEIENIIKEYLLENPEVIETAIIELNRRRTLARMLPSIELYRGFLENEPGIPVLGNPDGDVTIVEFFDYRCGFCRRHYGEVLRLVENDKNIRWIPRHYPILDREGQTPLSMLAARAAEAAHRQGKFLEFHTALMQRTGELTEEQLFQIAEKTGLDVPKLRQDMNDKVLQKRIYNALSIGHEIGFTGTPGYIIGEDVVLGAEGFERLKEAVDRARAKPAAE